MPLTPLYPWRTTVSSSTRSRRKSEMLAPGLWRSGRRKVEQEKNKIKLYNINGAERNVRSDRKMRGVVVKEDGIVDDEGREIGRKNRGVDRTGRDRGKEL